jgi:hypothetical protein
MRLLADAGVALDIDLYAFGPPMTEDDVVEGVIRPPD